MTPPAFPFNAVGTLFLSTPDSELRRFLDEAHRLVVACPKLVELVEQDLDAHGRAKKAMRLRDAAWQRRQTQALPFEETAPSTVDPARLTLAQGRPRTPAYVVLLALLLRGFFGTGFKACDATTLLQESITVHVFFANLGMTMPGRSTLTELVNAVTEETRLRILDAQVAHVLDLGWDDFSVMLQDSTHVEGNTAWPTDSRTLVALATRGVRVGAALDRLHLPPLECKKVHKHLQAMKVLDREIDLAPRTKERARTRRRRYEKLLWRARRVVRPLDAAVRNVEQALDSLDVLPSRKAMAARAVARLRADVDAMATVIAHCEARVVHETKVPATDKVLSVSDPDAALILKGQRVPVIGYKPQIARSGAGFITGLLLPKGNASDSKQLLPMVDEVIARTSVRPRILSVDDGYASRENVQTLDSKGIEVVSIHGAKGRALTARADWNSDEYLHARDLRSAVESLIFTLKHDFDFGYVARRGLSAAYAEMLEKALAYNLCRMAMTRRAVLAEERCREPDLPRAA